MVVTVTVWSSPLFTSAMPATKSTHCPKTEAVSLVTREARGEC